MKNRIKLVVVFLCLSTSAFSQAFFWSDLKLDESYTLEVKLDFEAERVHLEQGTLLELIDIVGMDMINVTLFRLRMPECMGSDLSSDIYLLPVLDEDSSMFEVGFSIDKGCDLELFIETKDYYRNSILKPLK